jgi:next-to-BRCA1 protein 1
MGDRPRPRPAAVEIRSTETNAPASLLSGVQTVVDVQPSVPAKVQPGRPLEVFEVDKKLAQLKLEDHEDKTRDVAEIKEAPSAVVKPDSADELVATYVRDTVQDGTTFEPDHVFEQTWVLRNDGHVAWPAGCSLRFVGGDYMGHLDSNHPAATKDVESSCESTICHASIQPGEEFPFTVLLRTPHRAGRVVSNWRLTTKEGMQFGSRLWCDVNVKPKLAPPPPPPPAAVTEPLDAPKQEEDKEAVQPAPISQPGHSQMIFPKLEKESPVASVHEDTKAEPAPSVEDEYEDCEWDDDEEEEAFLTDEEYDVLDASDEESLSGKQK